MKLNYVHVSPGHHLIKLTLAANLLSLCSISWFSYFTKPGEFHQPCDAAKVQFSKLGILHDSAVGRSYSVVRKEDHFESRLVETESPPTLHPSTVVAISTYKREIEQLDAWLTGDLILKGEHGKALTETKLLVKW